jgi:pilus assembly protein Flp/PilA
MKKTINRFLRDESGVTAIEYGLIAALVGVAIIIGAGLLGTALNSTFATIANTIGGVGSATP